MLVARYGPDLGPELAAEAVTWAWEHPERMATLSNPAGYLYRVATRWPGRNGGALRAVRFPAERVRADEAEVRGDVFDEPARLKPEQRSRS